ncbi:hypothetical protein BDN71DRAFT_250115 [Pleurotus eryngii]|uniref:Secreted protein n=1 Tax=Pleurotus eryngii TaxID=5323 RepID=A0A9P6D2E3_PLEER|nr:hypothetical protein BDN71DRAFT_250115 [Pleurotus eryngii]
MSFTVFFSLTGLVEGWRCTMGRPNMSPHGRAFTVSGSVGAAGWALFLAQWKSYKKVERFLTLRLKQGDRRCEYFASLPRR